MIQWVREASGSKLRRSLVACGLAGAMLVAAIPASAATRTITCSNVTCLKNALSDAQPGDDIVLASGVTFNGKFVAAANGTSGNKIKLRSASAGNRATLDGGGTGSGYALHITGDNWEVKDLKVTNAQKGIMLDHSNNTVIDNAEVYNVGQEAVHFRDGSSNNTIKNSSIHDTGLVDPGFGEGVYVGSDKGKWGTYAKEANNNRITNVTFGPNVRAEHVDIKEGTTGTIVEYSTFNGTGISGANYADSFIDIKGNNVIIRNNTGNRNNNSNIVDAFQVHQQVAGWGLNAQILNNTLNLNTAAPYIVNASSGTSATASGNTRTPSGNMYKGNVN
ncbi:right-handed parallel beta-helix repeat-containing protein [Paenibacillus filicis]|uniref:Right-handed parallel beta-helix repeat-containing protein n=1 Tax=Paenibacillus filicis TaxID=669464 RepID=A0ABU9DFY1_9BACL